MDQEVDMEKKCQYTDDWKKTYVGIEIERTDHGGNYYDACHNDITVKRDSVPGGYKKYTQTFGGSATNIAYMKHYGTIQEGFTDLNTGMYKGVCAYYLDYDDGNVIPLVVKLTKNGGSSTYYTKKNGTPNTWQSAGITKDGEIAGKLKGIGTSLTNFIVLKLDPFSETYYANGDPENQPAANPTTTITVSGPNIVDGEFKRYTYILTTKMDFGLLSTLHHGKVIPFKDPDVYTKTCNSVSVYYWDGDTSFDNPLLLEVAHKSESKRYYWVENKIWRYDERITDGIKEILIEQNFKYNKSHAVDISKTGKDDYDCSTCIHPTKNISLRSQDMDGYKKITHTLNSKGCISKVISDKKTQNGITFADGANSIDVYFYPKDNGEPLLIHYSEKNGEKWYRREKEANEWEDETSMGNEDPSRIKKLLQEIKDSLTIKPTAPQNGQERKTPNTPAKPSSEGTKGQQSHAQPSSGTYVAEEKDTSDQSSGSSVAIAVGITIGALIAGLLTYEVFMIRRNPNKSLTMRLMGKTRLR